MTSFKRLIKNINCHLLPVKIDEQNNCIDVILPQISITIVQRPAYCDRGRFGIIICNINNEALTIDDADKFPRYFFSLQRLFDELDEWINGRKHQLVTPRIKNYLPTEEHKRRHEILHSFLDELIADYILCTNKLLNESSIMDLIKWSAAQKKNPANDKI